MSNIRTWFSFIISLIDKFMPKSKIKTLKVKPIGDRALLKPDPKKEEGRTASGIIIPESADADRETKRAIVVEVGRGKFVDGKYLEPEIKKGDRVLYTWGDEISIDSEKYVLVNLDNITAIIS